jgi:hypothetical protein
VGVFFCFCFCFFFLFFLAGFWPSSKGQQLSTVLSDFVLCLVSLFCAYYLYTSGSELTTYTFQTACLGFLAIAVASFVGCIRFSGLGPHKVFVTLHDGASSVATLLGVPLIAVAVLYAGEANIPRFRFHQILPVVPAAAVALVTRGYAEKIGSLPSILGTLVIVVKAIALLFAFEVSRVIQVSALLLSGVVCLVVSGEYLKKKGRFVGGMRGVDVFHYVLAAALVLFMFGIVSALPLGQRKLILLRWIFRR